MRKLLIAVYPAERCAELTSRFCKSFQVSTCSDGPTAYRLLSDFAFDGLILSMMLPEMDGLTLLQRARGHLPPVILATTAFTSAYVQQTARDLGVGYLLLEPCSLNVIVTRMNDMLVRSEFEQTALTESQAVVADHLKVLGVPVKLNGYAQLRVGIPYFAQDMSQELAKELYYTIGERFGKDSKQVERSIRVAIDTAWKQRDEDVWRVYFRPDKRGRIVRPTNKQFISRLAQILADGI